MIRRIGVGNNGRAFSQFRDRGPNELANELGTKLASASSIEVNSNRGDLQSYLHHELIRLGFIRTASKTQEIAV